MFENFDFSILDDPEFKEDAVREELVFPILKRLGYSAHGTARIIRSRSLVHPFVMIGSQKRRINIIPDYLLTLEDKNGFVLDAKAPSVAIAKSENVEQVYSYAIHPDVRVPIYALCNGLNLVVYDIHEFDPVFSCPLTALDENWEDVVRILGPDAIANPHLRNFNPDFGLRALKAGLDERLDWYFIATEVDNFQKISAELVTVFSGFNDNGVECALSLDLPSAIFEELLGTLDGNTASQIEAALSQNPFRAILQEPLVVNLEARLAQPIKSTETNEVFVPFTVHRFVK